VGDFLIMISKLLFFLIHLRKK